MTVIKLRHSITVATGHAGERRLIARAILFPPPQGSRTVDDSPRQPHISLRTSLPEGCVGRESVAKSTGSRRPNPFRARAVVAAVRGGTIDESLPSCSFLRGRDPFAACGRARRASRSFAASSRPRVRWRWRPASQTVADRSHDRRPAGQARQSVPAAARTRTARLPVRRERREPANDPGDYRLAESVATCLDEQHPGDPSALLLRGHALHQLHRFQEAEAIARTLVTKREFVLDYALLGDALMEQGRLAEAADRVPEDDRPQAVLSVVHARRSSALAHGRSGRREELIQKAIASASPRNPESIAWAYTRLAFYELQRGHLDQIDARATDASARPFSPTTPPHC